MIDNETILYVEILALFTCVVIDDFAIRQYTIDIKENSFNERCFFYLLRQLPGSIINATS